MKQEPVAWTDDLWNIFLNDEYCMLDDDMKKDMIPLYTHPAKTLTDEEIHQIFRDESGFEIDTCPIAILDFAKAILKKASEK